MAKKFTSRYKINRPYPTRSYILISGIVGMGVVGTIVCVPVF